MDLIASEGDAAMAHTQVMPETSIAAALHRTFVMFAERHGLGTDLTELAHHLVAVAATHIPAHRIPTPETSGAALDSVVEASMRAAIATTPVALGPGGDFWTGPNWQTRLRQVASEWAHSEVPLSSVLALFDRGFDRVLDGLIDCAEHSRLLTANVKVLVNVRAAVITSVVGVFASSAVGDVPGSARRAFVSALLAGRTDITRATEVGITPATRYQVVALSVGSPEDATRLPTIARLETAVRRVFGTDLLSLLSDAGGTMLLPLGDRDECLAAADIATLVDLVGAPVVATRVEGPASDIVAMAHQADELLDLADAIGKPSGIYTLEDLVVEYLLTRPSPAHDRLAAMIEPLESNVELLQTLRVHMASGMNRRETARRLCVHPNTVDNRMARVATAIGVDLTRPEAIARTHSAMLAFDTAPHNRARTPQASLA